jgi:aryl-alcohol dehydrogenase-like predicted oxidoreductase
METLRIEGIDAPVSRVGLGTWAIGGWMWGGMDDLQSIATIRAAIDSGINLIDTAPVYGFGHSEEVVSDSDLRDIDALLALHITDPVGPEFMAPPTRQL